MVRFYFILGASSDFDNATKIAKRMVTKFGMSEKVIDFFNWQIIFNYFQHNFQHLRDFFFQR